MKRAPKNGARFFSEFYEKLRCNTIFSEEENQVNDF